MKVKMKMESKRKREEEEWRRTSKKKMKMKMKMEANIPTELLVDMLSRLPAKCVWRLRSVCKDWKSLIEAPSFADLQLKEKEGEVFMFWGDRKYRRDKLRTRFYSIDKHNGKSVRVVEEFLHRSETRTSSINGLVCYYGTDRNIKVCNPVTRETITLPKPTFLLGSSKSLLDLGIGFDSTTNTYKVLATSCLNPPQVEIFTLGGTNPKPCWRKLQLPSSPEIEFYFEGGFYANGCAFWETCINNQDAVMTFNFSHEKFEFFPFPPDIDNHYTASRWMTELGGRGCLIETKKKTGMVKLWTLATNSSAWVPHHALLPRFKTSLPESLLFPIPSGVMLFKRSKNRRAKPRRCICFYNHQGHVVKSVKVHGIPRRFSPLQLHTETLVSLRTILAANL